MSRGLRIYEAAWWPPYGRSDTVRTFGDALEAAAWLRAQAGGAVAGRIIRRRGVDGWRVVGSWPGLPDEEWEPPARDRANPGRPPQGKPRPRLEDGPPVPGPMSEALADALGIG